LVNERGARQVVDGRVAPNVELPNDNPNLCWASHWESWSASNLVGERVARQVVNGILTPYVEPPSEKALGESLLGES
jgi:hypothetical protein